MKTPELHILCNKGDLYGIQRLFEQPETDISTKDDKNRTVLHLACKRGYPQIVEFVLENGGARFIDDQDGEGKTALYEACCRGEPDIVRILLSHGAYINVISSSGNVRASKARQALRGACKHQHLEIVQMLVEKGADINTKNSAKETALYESCRDGHVDIVSYLLEMGADSASPNSRGLQPLHVAVREKQLNVVCLLLGNKADASTSVVGQAWTPLHIAASVDHVGITEALLRYGGDVDARTSEGQTPLYMASREGHTGVVELLVQFGASTNLRSDGGYTPLHAAAWEGHLPVAHALLEAEDIDLEAVTNFAQTAYNVACERCHFEVAALLLSHGVGSNLLDGAVDEPRILSPVHVSPLPAPPETPPPPPEKKRLSPPEDSKPKRKASPVSDVDSLDRLEKEQIIINQLITYLSDQPSVNNRWEKILINIGLEKKKVNLIKGNVKLDVKGKISKGLRQWFAAQGDEVTMDDMMSDVAEVLKHNNIGLNTTAGAFERLYRNKKKSYHL